MSQLASSVSKLESQGKLPAQTEKNPRHTVCAITIRSGMAYEGPSMSEKKEENIMVEEKTGAAKEAPTSKNPLLRQIEIQAPFPERLRSTKREREEQEIMDTSRRVEVNVPLLDANSQVPRYAKFLKELCTSKKKLKGNETIQVSENISAILQKRLPPKCKDPGIFTVPCKLGNLDIPSAMIDLGASINVLPYSIFKTFDMRMLKKTGVIVQLADRSIVHPKGVLEDVLVQVNELVFPADFYVLDMGDDDNPTSSSILLGRPFLKTAKTKIDVDNGTLSMEFDGDVINFNICEAIQKPSDVQSLNFVDIIQHLKDEDFIISNHKMLVSVLDRDLDETEAMELNEKFKFGDELMKIATSKNKRKKARCEAPDIKLRNTNSKLFPVIVQEQKLELKHIYEGFCKEVKKVDGLESPTYSE